MEENLKSIIDDMKKYRNCNSEIIEKISLLKTGDIILVESNKDLINILQLYKLKMAAYKNIFIATKFNIMPEIKSLFDYDKFIKEYSEILEVYEAAQKYVFECGLGENAYNYLCDNYEYKWYVSNADTILNITIIERKGVKINDKISK